MKRLIQILCASVFLLSFCISASAQVNTFQAQPGYVSAIQAQLNNLQNEISSFLLPPGATAGQFVVENAAGTAYIAATITGDISCSISVPGDCTISSISTNPLITKNIEGNPVGGPYGITGLLWDGVIDPRAFGCHNDVQTDNPILGAGISVINNSTTVTSTDDPWKSTDCHSGSGCTGPNDKVFRIERVSGTIPNYTSDTGTITGFTNSGQITISAPYPDTTEMGDQMEFGTADDIPDGATGLNCVTGINGAISGGGTTSLGPIAMQVSIPILTTTTWTMQNWTGWISGMGMGMHNIPGNTPSLSPGIYYFGQTPDIPIIERINNNGLSFRDIAIIGATVNPPSWCIEDVDNEALPRPGPNVLNTDYDVACGGFFGLGGIDDGDGAGSAVPTGNITVGETAVTVASAPAAPRGLGPNQHVYALDNSGTNGLRENLYTSPTYHRNDNPILFANGFVYAHTAANVTLYWGAGSVIHAFGTDVTPTSGSNNERHAWYHISARNVDSCITNGSNNASDLVVFGGDCTNDFTGIDLPNGGTLNLHNVQIVGTCLEANMAGTFATVNIDGSSVQRANYDACGPGNYVGYTSQIPGIALVLSGSQHQEARASGGPTYLNYTNFNSDGDLGGNMPPDGTMFDIPPTSNLRTVDIKNYVIADNLATGANAPAVNAYINIHPAAASINVTATSYSLDVTKHLSIIDPGFADNRYQRRYDVDWLPSFSGQIPSGFHRTLVGTAVYSEAVNQQDINGGIFNHGSLTIQPLLATTPFAPVFTGTPDGVTYCFYRVWYTDAAGYPNAVAPVQKVACTATLNGSNYVQQTGIAPPGSAFMHVARAQATATADPGGELEVSTSPVSITHADTTSNIPPELTDNVEGSLGGAYPLVNSSGSLTVDGFQNYPNPQITAISALPSPCATATTPNYSGQTGWQINNQATSCNFWATPLATASAGVDCPVRCDPITGVWRIGN